MPPPVPPQNGLDAINYFVCKDDYDKFISANSTDAEYYVTENLIFFSQKHLNDLVCDLCLSKVLASR